MTHIIPQETTLAAQEMVDYERISAEIEDRDAKRRRQGLEVIAFNKSQIFPRLLNAGVTLVTLEYSGSGDSGCAADVCAYIGCASTTLPEPIVQAQYQSWDCEIITECVPLTNAIETMCMDIAETFHQGWENGCGAFGEFRLDIASGTISLEHNQRHDAYDSSSHEW
jgi:hypothetical protein